MSCDSETIPHGGTQKYPKEPLSFSSMEKDWFSNNLVHRLGTTTENLKYELNRKKKTQEVVSSALLPIGQKNCVIFQGVFGIPHGISIFSFIIKLFIYCFIINYLFHDFSWNS